MEYLRPIRYSLALSAAAGVLAACSTASKLTPLPTVSGFSSASVSPNTMLSARLGRSRRRDLLYVTSGEDVNVYSYPRGALLGSLGNVGGNLCSDKAGDVFDSFNAEVLEYAHGAELPKETLYTPSFAGPCSVDPTSGNLGVVSGFPNAVVVFPYNQKRGWRFAKEYIVANMEFVHYCGYDGSGNLFIDGTTSSGYAFAELPKDGKVVEPLVLNQNFVNPGAIQWDGSYITFADRGQSYPSAAVIYRFTVSGYFGTEVGSTTLSQSNADGQFWIQDGRVVGQYLPAKYDDGVGIWAYPAGGAPLKTFATGTIADSETVSVAGR